MLRADELIYVQVLIAVQTWCETTTGSLPGLSSLFQAGSEPRRVVGAQTHSPPCCCG